MAPEPGWLWRDRVSYAEPSACSLIFQENRTPDSLFHGLPNASIAESGINSHGQTIPLTPLALAAPYDLDHSHEGFLAYYDNGKMDGADTRAGTCAKTRATAPLTLNLPDGSHRR
jgi:hypothetical protein